MDENSLCKSPKKSKDMQIQTSFMDQSKNLISNNLACNDDDILAFKTKKFFNDNAKFLGANLKFD